MSLHVYSQQGGMGTFQIPAVGYEGLGGGCTSFSLLSFVIVAREMEAAQNDDVTGGVSTLHSLAVLF